MCLQEDQKNSCIRILDDDEELLEALEFALTHRGWRCRCYNDVNQFLRDPLSTVPGCLLLDIQMPGMDGLEVQRQLEKRAWELTIIFMSSFGTLDTAIKAFRGGAFDFFKKPIQPEELFKTVEKAVRRDLQRSEQHYRESPKGKLEQLTSRERQVAADLAQGLPSALISEHLGISERTLERHRQNVFKKFGATALRDFQKLYRQIHN